MICHLWVPPLKTNSLQKPVVNPEMGIAALTSLCTTLTSHKQSLKQVFSVSASGPIPFEAAPARRQTLRKPRTRSHFTQSGDHFPIARRGDPTTVDRCTNPVVGGISDINSRFWGSPMLTPPFAALFGLLGLGVGQSGPTQTYELLARTGQPATVAGDEIVGRFLSDSLQQALPGPVINGQGDVLAYTSLGGSVGSSDLALLVRSHLGVPRLAARRYMTVPGYPVGTAFFSFPAVLLAESGDAVLKATLTGGSVTPGVNDTGVWRSASDDELVRIARTGDIAPQTDQHSVFNYLSAPTVPGVANSNLSTLPARIKNPQTGQEYEGVWMPSASTPRRIAQGYPAPGLSATVTSVTVATSRFGNLLYLCTLAGAGVQNLDIAGTPISNATGLWSDSGVGVPQLVARTGQQLGTDTGAPVLASLFDVSRSLVSSANGSTFFAGNIVSPVTGQSLGEGLWRSQGGAVQPVFVTGDPVVGSAGASIAGLSTGPVPAVAACGENVVILANLSGAGLTFLNNTVLLKEGPLGLELIAQAMGPAPGCPSGQVFAPMSFASAIACSTGDTFAFCGRLQGAGVTSANDRAVWLVNAQSTVLAFREGDQIGPYLISEVLVGSSGLHVNEDGCVLAECDLVHQSSPNGTRYRSLVGWSPCAGTMAVAITGRPIQLGTGDTPNVMAIRMAPSQALNNHGRAVFATKFYCATGADEAVVAVQFPECGQDYCPADYDHSGTVAIADIVSFLTDWFVGNADYNRDGVNDQADVFAFLIDWFAGCPD